jgi:S1-C subfamily serine protease/DNA-directed RNA polymerase subunit RPC12/RpoP
MPRVTCPKCKLAFSVADPNRKSTECPDCGYRIVVGGNAEPPRRPRPAEDAAAAAGQTTKGISGTFLIGGVLLAFICLGAIGGGIWYFKFHDSKAVAKSDEPPPPVDPATDPKTKLKHFKPAPAPELADTEIYNKLLPATVWIRFEFVKDVVENGRRVPAQFSAWGSGVLICSDPNPLVLTNEHVVSYIDAERKKHIEPVVEVYFPVLRPNGEPEVDTDFYLQQKATLARVGRVVKTDPRRDTAIVRLESAPENAKPIPMAAESAHRLEKVFGIGNSGGKRGALWRGNSGDVRNIEEKNPYTKEPCRFLTTQQPINHGDSGGPIVNRRVELVAITRLGEEADVNNVSYNVDVSELRDFAHMVYRQEYNAEFPTIAPVVDPGAQSPPADENMDVADYIQILREGDPSEAQIAVGRLIHAGGRSVHPLMDVLEDQKSASRWPLALKALEGIGEPASDALKIGAERLKSDDPAIRVGAARFIGAVGPAARKHVPELVVAGGVNNPEVRAACEKSIIKLGPYGAADLNMILGSGDDKNEYVRAFRAKLLVEVDLPQEQLVKRMETFFKDDSSIVRAEAVRAVFKPRKFPRQDMHRLAIPLLADKDYAVRLVAFDNLYSVGRVELEDLETFRPFFESDSIFIHRYLLTRVRDFGEKAAPIVPELSKSLNFHDDEIKEKAIDVVLGIGRDMKSLTKDFITLSKHEKPTFRVKAISCLDLIGKGEPGVVAALFDRLSDDAVVAAVPRNTEQALLRTYAGIDERRKAIKDLRPYDKSKEVPVWLCAVRVLDQMSPYKTEAQIREIQPFLKRDPSRSVLAQFNAAAELANSGAAARIVLNDLAQTLADPNTTEVVTKESLCAAIGNCGPEASAACATLAEHAVYQLVEDRARASGDSQRILNQRVRTAALRALGRLGNGAQGAMAALTKLADPAQEPDTLDEVIKTLGNIGPGAASAVPNLMELFLKARPAQRELLVDTMKKIGPEALPPMIEFLPKYEKQWRENVGPFKDQMAKAKGCIECIIVLGPESLKPEKRAKLIDDLKALRARAVIKRDKEFEGRLAEAISRLDVGKK